MKDAGTVWYAVPSIRPPAEAMRCLGAWAAAGYRTAVVRDFGADPLPVDLCLHLAYRGYAAAVNGLCREILRIDPDAAWVVTGGDDLYPDRAADPRRVAGECAAYFGGTFGVMQPTGDRHLEREGVCSSERACVSPWMGREWCRLAYGGRGPLHEGYFHCFVDEELREVAKAASVLWERPDLCQFHDWWDRRGDERPAHLDPARIRWEADKELFTLRRMDGFPGSAPCHPQ